MTQTRNSAPSPTPDPSQAPAEAPASSAAPTPATAPRPWTSIPAGGQDVRLVVCDMDGTLLTPQGEVPARFWALQERLRERGILFVPASGRQLATLEGTFGGERGTTTYIAENGTVVVRDGEIVATVVVDRATVLEVVDAVRRLVADGAHDLGLVVCGARTAYVERTDEAFLREARTYYRSLEVVEDLATVADIEGGILKLAVHDAVDAEATAREDAFRRFEETQQVVVSGRHWIDVMNPAADKGRGVQALQRELGIAPAQTAVFGDYLNDLEMYAQADWSFAMAAAHPDIIAAANYLAPGNDEDGVVRVLAHLLDLELDADGR
ncbi:Cof-type HAD-IIB family hydrolase [Brachybacterium sp. DNPG3]